MATLTIHATPEPADRRAVLHDAAALYEARRFPEADALCRSWLERAPDDAEALFLRGLIANDNGHPAAALALIEAAIARDGSVTAWQVNRAIVLHGLGRTNEALGVLDAAIARDPDLIDAHVARAELLMAGRCPSGALASLEQIIRLRPDNVDAILLATHQMLMMDRLEEALARADAELALRPADARSHLARANILRAMNRLDEAIASCERSTELRDDYAKAWFVKGLSLLTQGHYAEGWPLYEWRWLMPEFVNKQPALPMPLWDGSPLAGRSLLVHAEQGLGDTIQFYRFLAGLRGEARVLLYPPAPLARLFAAQPDAPSIVGDGETVTGIDLYCMLGSLPWLLGAEPHNLPPAPYLRADPALAAIWEARLPPPRRPRIGIVWAGNPTHPNDSHRSMPLGTMLEMLDPAERFVSLQKDVPDADRDTLERAANVVDLGRELTDFADAAALMDRLDLIIAVDTAPAHLAGALGKKLWLLLPFAPDWRWMLEREDSPWYPSARLFRQTRPGDWSDVVRRVREALTELLAR